MRILTKALVVFGLLIGSVAAQTSNLFDMSDTWNDVGTTFSSIKMDVTDTTSAADSMLLQLQVGSIDKFVIEKDGSITIAVPIAITAGGTGSATAGGARTNLSLVPGTDIQVFDAGLLDIAGLAVTDSNFIVGDGVNWVVETGATVRASLGLVISTDVQAHDAQLDDIAALAVTNSNFIVGDGVNWVAETGATARTSLGVPATADVLAVSSNLSDVASAVTSFNNVSPVTTRGDIIIRGITNNERLAVGSVGEFLTTNGTDVSWGTPGGGGDLLAANNLSDVGNANTSFNTISPVTTRGDIIVRNATVNARLAVGTVGQVLTSDGTDAAWAAVTGDLLAANDLSDVDDAPTALTNLGAASLIANTFTDAQTISDSLTGAEATSVLDLASTWNTSGTPTGLRYNVTDTASNAASLLFDLRVGGSSKFKVAKDGELTLVTALSIASGGTGATTASAARTALSVVPGTDVQTQDAGLQDIAGLATTDNNIIVGSGSNWVAENGATARASLGVLAIADVLAVSSNLSDVASALTSFNNISPVTTRGDIVIRGITNNERLAVGTVGQFLTTDGTDVSWGAGGSGDLLASNNLSDVDTAATALSNLDGAGLSLANTYTVSLAAGTGDEDAMILSYTTNKATSGDDTGLLINQTDTLSPGISLLFDAQVGGSSMFSVNNTGEVSIGGVTPVAGTKLLVPSEDDAVTPTIAFGDGNTGFYESVDNTLRVALAGTMKYFWTSNEYRGALGGMMINVAVTDTVPTLGPRTSDYDTGIGSAAANQLSLIAGGVEQVRLDVTGNHIINSLLDVGTGDEDALRIEYTTNKDTSGDDTGLLINQTDTASPGVSLLFDAQVGGSTLFNINNAGEVSVGGVTPVAGTKMLLPSENDAVTPTLAFGDGNTGFYESADNQLTIASSGAGRFIFNGNQFKAFTASGPQMSNGTPSATNPVFLPNNLDVNTGIGTATADNLSLIAGGVEAMRYIEAGTVGITQTHQMIAGLTADVGSVQGGQPLVSSYNEISTCANAGDAVTLPAAVLGKKVTVINNGANAADVFPASGDDLGEGANLAASLAVGDSITYLAIDATNWEILSSTAAPPAPNPIITPDSGELVIASGVITVTGSFHTVDDQSGNADDLVTINGGVDGQTLILMPDRDNGTVTVKDGTGNIQLLGDFVMDNFHDSILLIYSGVLSAWVEISRSNNGA